MQTYKETMAVKILLDTDIGSDIDDALCLAYLLAHPDCELLGITTVSGEAVKRAQLASILCKVAGKQLPIFPGAEEPLLLPYVHQPKAPQASILDTWDHESTFPLGEAVDFLRQTIHAFPGEVTLLAIGALTNIALLFRLDPEIPFLLKGLVMMCGLFTNRVAGWGPCEWNALQDPHATAIVYQATMSQKGTSPRPASHRSIGLDVTTQVALDKQPVLERLQAPFLAPVVDMAQVWWKDRPLVTFHDPLAAATLFDEQICQFTPGTVTVELLSDKLQGFTHWNPRAEDPHHEVALQVNSEEFFDHYFRIVNQYVIPF
jgi:inosine-uridine nucleoside N-ribohydrolase